MQVQRMKVVGYVRVSTEEQAREGVSLEAQEQKLRMFCDLHDLDLVQVLVDAGVSAKTLDRPALQQGLLMLRTRRVQGLVVAKLDRLSRSVRDWNELIDGYFGDRAGKTLMSVTDSIDTRTAAGRLVLNVLMSVAQWEREAISERTRDALQHLKAQGVALGGARPECRALTRESRLKGARAAGRASAERARLEYDPELVLRVQGMRKLGLTLRLIAQNLNADRVPTRTGKIWGAGQVKRLIDMFAPESGPVAQPAPSQAVA